MDRLCDLSAEYDWVHNKEKTKQTRKVYNECYYRVFVSLRKTIQAIKTLENRTSTSYRHIWANQTMTYSNTSFDSTTTRLPSVGEDTRTNPKTSVKKLALNLESKEIDPLDFKNKSLRHPTAPRPLKKTP